MAISRILLTGDILRPLTSDPRCSESVRRIQWFEDLLMLPLAEVTPLPVTRLACEGRLDIATLYGAAGLPPSPDSWAQLYAGELAAPLQQLLLDLFRDSLVISIELPPSIAQLLHRAGIPVIDAMVDPIRFLLDVPLGWRSPFPEVRQALEPFRVSPFEVRRHVAQIKAKGRWLAPVEIPPNATLLLGQVADDSALIDPRRGVRATWADFADRVEALKMQGPIIWRPHPHNPSAPAAIADLLGDAARSSGNFYQLLGDDRLARVAAISSGGVVEARAFGKEGIHFMDRMAGITVPGWSATVPVVGEWLSPHFWSAVLAPLVETRRDVPMLVVEPHAFRRSINCDWGFGWIDQVQAA